MNRKHLQQLAGCGLFDGIDPDEINVMIDCMQPQVLRYRKNELVTLAGTELQALGIVMAGSAAITKESAGGHRVIMGVVGPGDMFGEMAAFSRQKAWPATVVSQSDCQVAFLPSAKIVGTCERQCISHRRLILNMLGILSDKALFLNKRVEYLSIRNLRQKVGAFLLDRYEAANSTIFMLPMDRQEMADYLNVTRPALSREMGRMREEGLIDYQRSSIKILDLDGLRERAVRG